MQENLWPSKIYIHYSRLPYDLTINPTATAAYTDADADIDTDADAVEDQDPDK